MPSKAYKTITIKVETFEMFQKIHEIAKKTDSTLDNSKFFDTLLDNHKK